MFCFILISIDTNIFLFDWSLYTKYLNRSNDDVLRTLIEKEVTVVGYFFALCYDLCLSSMRNVSNNPGFARILGVFSNAT